MEVLQINNYHYLRGGSERVYFETARLLEEHGHRVTFFSVAHPQNISVPADKYFGKAFDPAAASGLAERVRAAALMIFSPGNNRQMDRLLDAHEIQVAHAHNIYGRVCPSVLRVLAKRGIPTVLTVHDYKLCCPIYICFRNESVCTRCVENGVHNVVLNRCTKGSLLASVVHYMEHQAHRIMGYYSKDVSLYACPSRFLRELLVRAGLPEDRLVHLPNFLRVSGFEPEFGHNSYVLYAGRLAQEKGVHVLVDAMQGLEVELRIAGEGPLRAVLEDKVRQRGQANVRFVGHLSGSELADAYRKAALTIVPSLWFENQPMSILESFAYGTPVVASDHGALPELVVEGVSGAVFEPGNTGALRERIRHLMDHESEREGLARSARQMVEEEFDEDVHYRRLLDLYERAQKK